MGLQVVTRVFVTTLRTGVSNERPERSTVLWLRVEKGCPTDETMYLIVVLVHRDTCGSETPRTPVLSAREAVGSSLCNSKTTRSGATFNIESVLQGQSMRNPTPLHIFHMGLAISSALFFDRVGNGAA